MNHAKYFTLGVRVANFSDIALLVDHLLEFDSEDINAIVKKIRQYADLPVVFVVSGSQARQIPANLAALKTIRSPCFPYALFTVGDTDLTVDDTEVDIVRIDDADALAIQIRIDNYVFARLRFDDSTLRVGNSGALPAKVDKKIQTVTGAISGMYENGVVVDEHQRIDADIVVNCIGFERNASLAQALRGQHEMTNINYVDKDFMYLADAYIEENKREWIDSHSILAGKPMKAEECMPYVFEKLLPKKQ